ncbi:MAG: TetR/AcrR family transcriptional regulator [Deltaproteobacteria bacterium]|nr:TetR/AcrR family transcriptional regulator [Deltaproteobacteria bacterium]
MQTQPPKSKLVETAAALIYRQGWNATGINQILTEARVPKGSFYYHFHSKDELGVAIVKFHGQKLQETYVCTLLNEQLTGREALEAFFDWLLERQSRNEWRLGCPIGSFTNEIADSSELIAPACREVLVSMLAVFSATILRGQKDQTIVATDDANELGMLVASALQGAMLLMKTVRQEAPLRIAIECIRRKLFRG